MAPERTDEAKGMTVNRVPAHTGCPAEVEIAQLLQSLLPGTSGAASELRHQVLAFCSSPSSNAVLLRGPVGSGKSSLARIISFCKRIAPLRPEEARRRIADLRLERPGRIDLKAMSWYVEFPVTGLIDSLAEATLFGIKKGSATDVAARKGVFEQAATGRGGDLDGGAGVTGGVVFLDEIADLSTSLQAKLLPVLSSGLYTLVGGEGERESEREFEGVVISATWQEPAGRVRQDLLSRLAGTVITLPSISERLEDLPQIVASIFKTTLERYQDRVIAMFHRDSAVDRAFFEARLKFPPALSLGASAALQRVDWSRYGDLRGLTTAIERVVFGQEAVERVLATLEPLRPAAADGSPVSLYDALMIKTTLSGGVAARVRRIEKDLRAVLRREVMEDPTKLARLAQACDLSERSVMEQIRQLDRTRVSSSRGSAQ